MIAHTVRCLYSSFVLLLSFMLLSNCGTTPVAQQPPTVETAPEDATVVPTIQPTTDDAALSPVPDAPTAPVAGEVPAEGELAYYWPATLPSGLAVNPNRVSISEQFYAMDTTIAEGRVLTLRGSTGTPTPNFSSEPELSTPTGPYGARPAYLSVPGSGTPLPGSKPIGAIPSMGSIFPLTSC